LAKEDSKGKTQTAHSRDTTSPCRSHLLQDDGQELFRGLLELFRGLLELFRGHPVKVNDFSDGFLVNVWFLFCFVYLR
jgi:hypothetical protein